MPIDPPLPDSPLRRLRELRGLTLQEVAAALGTDSGNLSRIERGRQTSPEMAEKLVAYFGIGAITEIQILYPQRFSKSVTAA